MSSVSLMMGDLSDEKTGCLESLVVLCVMRYVLCLMSFCAVVCDVVLCCVVSDYLGAR